MALFKRKMSLEMRR